MSPVRIGLSGVKVQLGGYIYQMNGLEAYNGYELDGQYKLTDLLNFEGKFRQQEVKF